MISGEVQGAKRLATRTLRAETGVRARMRRTLLAHRAAKDTVLLTTRASDPYSQYSSYDWCWQHWDSHDVSSLRARQVTSNLDLLSLRVTLSSHRTGFTWTLTAKHKTYR
jgi:hypothetical protein